MIKIINDAIRNEEILLPARVRKAVGMSGQKFRYVLNYLSERPEIQGAYFEVGTFQGSTALAALCGNNRQGILVDNWSEFGGPKKGREEFQKGQITNANYSYRQEL